MSKKKKRISCFKYLKKEYAESFSQGEILINTFDNIRIHEEKEIGDQEEATIKHKFNDVVIGLDNNIEEIRSHVRNSMIVTDASKGTRFINCETTIRLGNAWMFCVTKTRNDKYWNTLKESYDACFYIRDFQEFIERCTQFLHYKYLVRIRWDIDDCFYESNTAIVDQNESLNPSYFRKLPEYKIQDEARSILRPIENINVGLLPELVRIKVDDLIRRLF